MVVIKMFYRFPTNVAPILFLVVYLLFISRQLSASAVAGPRSFKKRQIFPSYPSQTYTGYPEDNMKTGCLEECLIKCCCVYDCMNYMTSNRHPYKTKSNECFSECDYTCYRYFLQPPINIPESSSGYIDCSDALVFIRELEPSSTVVFSYGRDKLEASDEFSDGRDDDNGISAAMKSDFDKLISFVLDQPTGVDPIAPADEQDPITPADEQDPITLPDDFGNQHLENSLTAFIRKNKPNSVRKVKRNRAVKTDSMKTTKSSLKRKPISKSRPTRSVTKQHRPRSVYSSTDTYLNRHKKVRKNVKNKNQDRTQSEHFMSDDTEDKKIKYCNRGYPNVPYNTRILPDSVDISSNHRYQKLSCEARAKSSTDPKYPKKYQNPFMKGYQGRTESDHFTSDHTEDETVEYYDRLYPKVPHNTPIVRDTEDRSLNSPYQNLSCEGFTQ
eukprot:876481_1